MATITGTDGNNIFYVDKNGEQSIPVNSAHGGSTTMFTGNGTDQTAAINFALSQIASGGTITFGPGLYVFKSGPIVINGSNIDIICDPNAVFQAQTGFITPNWPLVNIQTGTNITWTGGSFDGNAIAGRAIQVDSAVINITCQKVSVKNVTQYGLIGAGRLTGVWHIFQCSFSNLNLPAIFDFGADGNTAVLRVKDSTFSNIPNFAVGSTSQNINGVAYFEASGNTFRNCGHTDGGPNVLNALYGFQAGYFDWHDNTFISCTGACHADTFSGGGFIRNNIALNSTSSPDYFLEITPYVTVSGNIAIGNTGERGIIVGRGGAGVAPGTLLGVIVRDNKVINCTGGISWGSLTQPVIDGNYVENPNNGVAYQALNSVNTKFAFNQSVFSSGGTHLNIDASSSASSVSVYGDQSNASTMYSSTNGGTVIAKIT